jgi:hypothetical protein
MAAWTPAYARTWGYANFLHLCDAAVFLAFIGLWFGNRLLISSQAIASLFAGILWSLDVSCRLIAGHSFIGGTEYMWDPRYPLWARLLSLFHIALPLLLLYAVRKMGYDRRAMALQTGIAAALLVASRFFPANLNLNYAYRDPLLHRSFGIAPVHLAIILAGVIALLYWPAHLVLAQLSQRPPS